MEARDKIRSATCCFTGHREIPPEQEAALRLRLRTLLRRLGERGIRYFGAGGALGFDTMAAEEVLRLRESDPEVRLILVLPCADQTRGWARENVERYEEIRRRADKVVCLSQQYTRGCMHRRNRHLVDHSAVCVAYLAKQSGGTAYTVRYAMENGLTVFNLADGSSTDAQIPEI